MKDKNWRSIYKPKFPKVYEMCNYLEKIMQDQLPDVYDAILDSGVNSDRFDEIITVCLILVFYF